ncbi:uncharacterized protein L201_000234 [Kwoniella dendrophila CBS 6074]|uniref:Uncharacterized protein n=1 Tax=Kwoniella dendrophila CBS 6074 TaxID=1295534 RepID=A0AAX4JK51_9TREE
MKFFSTLAFLTSLSLLVSAKISEITIEESNYLSGDNVTVIVSSHSYIQNWDDFGIIWGLQRSGEDCDECIGQELGYQNLYGNNTLGNTTYSVPLPNTTVGEYVFKAAVPYLVGASGATGINYFNQTINLVSNARTRK